MRKKNGFTLVELLAVIAILGVILTITTISVVNTINKSKKDSKELSDTLIKNGAELYIAENSYTLNNQIKTNGAYFLKVQDLINKKYIKSKKGNNLTDDRCVQLSMQNDTINIDNISSCPVLLSEDDYTLESTVNGTRIMSYNGTHTSIIIPNDIDTINHQAFYLKNLTYIKIPDSVVDIGSKAFANNKLTSVIIPNSVTYIDFAAFADNFLTNITLPESVGCIESEVFSENPLTEIIVEGKDSLEDFDGCAPGLEEFEDIIVWKP